ncbi:Ig-like domain-containing protein [Bacillus sp. RG28]|uniref:Ig-like domain-containing protein n=1 Tax=Gottfriedia endophytica TaxID=2820819 RepID=A0A940NSN7_9BACI|nr:Ig-like domain-containing protein [Gottfriedia endophytica]MBP0726818.1 Ig-like domain-containing protein [Gottfriedia endophytica]
MKKLLSVLLITSLLFSVTLSFTRTKNASAAETTVQQISQGVTNTIVGNQLQTTVDTTQLVDGVKNFNTVSVAVYNDEPLIATNGISDFIKDGITYDKPITTDITPSDVKHDVYALTIFYSVDKTPLAYHLEKLQFDPSSATQPSNPVTTPGTNNDYKEIRFMMKDEDIKVGQTKEFKVYGIKDNDKKEDITKQATVKSSNENVLAIDGNKLIAKSADKAVITATFGDLVTSLRINVKKNEQVLHKLIITPEKVKLNQGDSVKIKVIAIYKGDKNQDVTKDVKWTILDDQLVTIKDGVITANTKSGSTKAIATFNDKQVKIEISVSTKKKHEEKDDEKHDGNHNDKHDGNHDDKHSKEDRSAKDKDKKKHE